MIMLLMGCIAFLEDTGYMARAAFIMDRLMHLMGLHGKSFIPLIMGTRLQRARRAGHPHHRSPRRTASSRSSCRPLVSCSARLQVYILIAGTFFKPLAAAFAILAMHFLGFVLAMLMGKVLRLTLFRGANNPFVMELPPYRMPVLKATLIHMWEKGSVFLSRAGTVILAGATLVWFLSHYPGITNRAWTAEHQSSRAALAAMDLPAAREDRAPGRARPGPREPHHEHAASRRGSARSCSPSCAPILDPDHTRPEAWKDGVALTAGFVAKEIVVGTLAVVHQASAEPADPKRPGESAAGWPPAPTRGSRPSRPSPSWSSPSSTRPASAPWA